MASFSLVTRWAKLSKSKVMPSEMKIRRDIAELSRLDGLIDVPNGWHPGDYGDFIRAERDRRAPAQ